MSYCVNCGVELDKSAVKCALCAAPVVNPFEPVPEGVVMPYSEKMVIPPGVRKRYVAFILSMVLLIPNLVCGVVNLLFVSTGNWAVYVAASSILAWILFLFPFLIKKPHRLVLTTIDSAATLLYVYFFYAFLHERDWFFRLAVPLTLLLFIHVFLFLVWTSRKKRAWPSVVSAVFAEIGVYSLCVDVLIHLYYRGGPATGFSVIVALCCASLIGFFETVARNHRLRAWLSRKFFV